MTIRTHRVKAFCDWLDTVPAYPPVGTLPAFQFFADLTDAEHLAAVQEMRRRASEDLALAEAEQLRIFLGELRAGADIETAAVAAEMSIAQAQVHARAEARGKNTAIAAVVPRWSISGGEVTLRIGGSDDDPESGVRTRLKLSFPQ